MSSAQINVYSLSHVAKGMSQAAVLQVMPRPFKYETFCIDADIYDVWFYITRVTALGQSRMVPQNLTPLTFKNGVLVDIGYVYYNYLLKEEEAREKAAASLSQPLEPASPDNREEDIELEKALKAPQGQPSQTPIRTTLPPPAPTPKPPAPKQTARSPSKASAKPSPQGQLPGKPSPESPQPPNVWPGEPAQPIKPVQKNPIAMCTKVRKPAATNNGDPSSEETPKEPQWDEEDQEREEEESEQNFDYW